ncbi:MAG TPA: LodA/GoxA family CTQ-dependent oxidase, partial [Longimicrobium sp.]|nr:LodA/GoxA family CTQ-dependent oxidase [Longimicrobium sp.]
KADPAFYQFQETAAQANASTGSGATEPGFGAYIYEALSHDNDFGRGLQPGDLTKYMALPWQADFNECSTQKVDITYADWNVIYPESDGDARLAAAQRSWEALWWPAHRPMQVFVPTGEPGQKPSGYDWLVWARGVPQTKEGDFKMVTEWWRLGFVRKNPWASQDMSGNTVPPPQTPPYISTEYTPRTTESDG